MARLQTEPHLRVALVVGKDRAMVRVVPAQARRVKETLAVVVGIYMGVVAAQEAAVVLEELVEAPIALEEAVEDLGPFLQ